MQTVENFTSHIIFQFDKKMKMDSVHIYTSWSKECYCLRLSFKMSKTASFFLSASFLEKSLFIVSLNMCTIKVYTTLVLRPLAALVYREQTRTKDLATVLLLMQTSLKPAALGLDFTSTPCV